VHSFSKPVFFYQKSHTDASLSPTAVSIATPSSPTLLIPSTLLNPPPPPPPPPSPQTPLDCVHRSMERGCASWPRPGAHTPRRTGTRTMRRWRRTDTRCARALGARWGRIAGRAGCIVACVYGCALRYRFLTFPLNPQYTRTHHTSQHLFNANPKPPTPSSIHTPRAMSPRAWIWAPPLTLKT